MSCRRARNLESSGWCEHVPFLTGGGHRRLLKRVEQLRKRETVYPPQDLLLRAFWETPWKNVRVLLLGQDPYHGSGQAQGLAFSVPDCVPVPPSLCNILREVRRDIYGDAATVVLSPDLTRWARQGVLLLNSILSVAAGRPLSHAALGWQELTQAVLVALAARQKPLAVLLWGGAARQYAPLFEGRRHLVLCAPHPSPLSAFRGFHGCGHFSAVNRWLAVRGETEICW